METLHWTIESRVWIYQSNKRFTNDQLNVIQNKLDNFTNEWNSHGQDVAGGYEIKNNQFILIFADENFAQVSGCSIDSSVTAIKELETELDLSLLDKSQVAFETSQNIEVIDFKDVRKAVSQKRIKPETVIFNNAVTTVGQMEDDWKILAKDSWINKYF